jgi:uncharacterized protein with HEPN domain
MSRLGLHDHIAQMTTAAHDALTFVDGLGLEDFLSDKRTQQAVTMSLIIIGEAATKVLSAHPEFAAAHPQVPWRSMRGMRNKIAHGYYEIAFDVVWETTQRSLPTLLEALRTLSRF